MQSNQRVAAITTCNKFWKRLNATAPYWKDMALHGHDGWFEMYVVTSQQPTYESKIFDSTIKLSICDKCRDTDMKIESKPMMLRSVLDKLRAKPPTYVLFTDADIVPPVDLYQTLLDQQGVYRVADRVDLSESVTNLFLSSGNAPKDGVLKPYPYTSKKRGMGWFQLVRWEALTFVMDKLPWKKEGYDLFDWELNKRLSEKCGSRVIQTSRPFFHLWHGPDGSTWNGTDKDW